MCYVASDSGDKPLNGALGLDLSPALRSTAAEEQAVSNGPHAARLAGHHRLLTRTVAETPEHKQVSGRLLHRQIKGR